MWQILGYILLVAVFVSISCAIVTWTPTAATARKRFESLLSISIPIAFLLQFYGGYPELLDPVIFLLIFSFVLSDFLFIRPLLRRRVIPPCVRVRSYIQGVRLVMEGAFVLIALGLMAYLPPERSTRLPMVISATLGFVSYGVFLIGTVYQRPEICANGVWYDGSFHEWSSFKCFAWREQGDKTVVELVYPEELSRPSKRIIVPPENCEAARKLLEANLPEEASA
jgi:hypothetical protein